MIGGPGYVQANSLGIWFIMDAGFHSGINMRGGVMNVNKHVKTEQANNNLGSLPWDRRTWLWQPLAQRVH